MSERSDRPEFPEDVRELGAALVRAGFEPWLVGGSARDALAGRAFEDFDLAAAATPEQLRARLDPALFPAEQPGESFGSLRLSTAQRSVELTCMRREAAYRDGRRPEEIEYVEDLRVDAQRRDFTVNAVYVSLRDGRVEDPCEGLADLRTRRLRVVGDAERRLREEPLRILRGLRFCASHDLVPDTETWAALCATSADVARVPRPRVFQELQKLLCSRGRARGLMLFARSGASAPLLPGFAELADVPQPPQYHPEGDVLRHTALVLACLEEPVDPVLAWSALFHDVAKRETFERAADRIRFHGHDSQSAERAEAWLRDFGARRDFTEAVASIVREHIRIASVLSFRPAKRERMLRDALFPRHLAFHRADCLASHRMLDLYGDLQAAAAALPPEEAEPLLRGRDLVELGLEPGPAIGRCLAELADARSEGVVETRAQALDFVAAFRSRSSMSGPSTPKKGS